MAASSSSSCNYEVFLNFRGEDTRKSFTCYLYDKLYEGKKIKTFIDDEELKRGDEISDALLNAIEGSKISVVIFSKDYASSKWCLNELVKILECKHTNGQIVIPVFYSVSPSDVRHQTGIFGHGFDKLEQQFKEKPEMVQKWRDALKETSHLAGHESTKFSNDAQLVNKIVEDVLKKMEKITVSTDSSDGLVGLNSRIEQIKPFLSVDLSDTVQIVGIWGVGGIGKTTLAKAIFDQFSHEFEGSCFMSDVRRNSETAGGLEHLQKQMLSRILSEKLEVAGPNIPHFTKERVRRMKVLIVLDDVNEVGQLEGLIGRLDQYGPGSRIVITTRNKHVLETFPVEKIYRVNGLKFDEAFEHFCNFAFKEKHCPEDFKRHSRRVVEYAHGNPLVLKVLGSSLKRKSHWGNVLDDLNRICESDIHNIYDMLKISFNELTPNVKSVFLDIACFFEGEGKDFVIRILDDSQSYGLNDVNVLIDKSLISVSGNCLQMHDLLQEMGRQIVRQESEKEPGKRSRLWDPKEIRRVLKHNMEAFKLKSINLSHSQHFIKMPGPLETPNVETYLLDYTNLSCVSSSIQNFKYLSRLCFEGCESLRSFPSNLHFVCPVTINFSYCVNLIEFPQISGKVTSLDLTDTAIEEVPSSIECLTDLKVLNLSDCKRLKRISTRFCKLRSLVDLFLSGCLNLERFPEILEKMEHLKYIYLVWTALPSSFENLPGLVRLSVSGCSILDKLPDNIGNLNGNNFESLPASIKQLSWLSYLYLEDCNMLQSLPELPLGLETLHLRRCNMLRSLPELPLGLETLRLWRCNMLQSLPALPLGLETLDLEDCNMLRSLPEIPSCLQELDASVLEKLSKPSPDLRRYRTSQPIYFGFTNCLELNGKANNKILADSLRMAIATSLRLGYENKYNEKLSELRESQIVLPGSEIPDWFSHQSSGSSIRIQLPPHSFCRNLIGFAFCAVLDFKQLYSDGFRYFDVGLEIKPLSETKHVDVRYHFRPIKDPHGSDHVILGFKPCLSVGFHDGYHHTTVSLKVQKGQKIKRCGVCPVYANPSEIKANTFTLNFATEVWKLDDLPSASGTAASEFDSSSDEGELYCTNSSSDEGELYCTNSGSDEGELYYSSGEEELEPSPKRVCRADQINTS